VSLQFIAAFLSLGAAVWTASSVSTLTEAIKAEKSREADAAIWEDMLAESRKESLRVQAENVRLAHEMNRILLKGN
jgi:hypothetical protein